MKYADHDSGVFSAYDDQQSELQTCTCTLTLHIQFLPSISGTIVVQAFVPPVRFHAQQSITVRAKHAGIGSRSAPPSSTLNLRRKKTSSHFLCRGIFLTGIVNPLSLSQRHFFAISSNKRSLRACVVNHNRY